MSTESCADFLNAKDKDTRIVSYVRERDLIIPLLEVVNLFSVRVESRESRVESREHLDQITNYFSS